MEKLKFVEQRLDQFKLFIDEIKKTVEDVKTIAHDEITVKLEELIRDAETTYEKKKNEIDSNFTKYKVGVEAAIAKLDNELAEKEKAVELAKLEIEEMKKKAELEIFAKQSKLQTEYENKREILEAEFIRKEAELKAELYDEIVEAEKEVAKLEATIEAYEKNKTESVQAKDILTTVRDVLKNLHFEFTSKYVDK